jgi:Tfp pilus assembly protein PilP
MKAMTSRRLVLVAVLSVAIPAAAEAQQPAQPAVPAKGAAAPTLPTVDTSYVYEPSGRRDPFISLVGRGAEMDPKGVRPPGLSGLLIGEVMVKGVLRDSKGFLAMLHAPDKKTYTVRVGDKLRDGTVKSINKETVVFSQYVTDPLSLVKQREVPKPVRQVEGQD